MWANHVWPLIGFKILSEDNDDLKTLHGLPENKVKNL